MQGKIPKKGNKKSMDSKSLLKGSSELGESEALSFKDEEKVEIEIREIVRIYARDFDALKKSFEEWAKQWEERKR
jgi:hypothetical protein